MNVKIPEELCTLIGFPALRFVNVDGDSLKWKKWADVCLGDFNVAASKKLLALVKPHVPAKIRGTGALVTDIENWINLVESNEAPRARTVRQFESIMMEVLLRVPGQRIYFYDEDSEVHLASYVAKVDYEPEYKSSSGTRHEYVYIDVVWHEFGGRFKRQVQFYAEDCVNINPHQALKQMGFCVETPELRKAYEKSREKFGAVYDKIGRQYLVKGVGVDNLDGNESGRDRRKGWWSSERAKKIILARDGGSVRMVIDLFKEGDTKDNDNEAHIDKWFWLRENKRRKGDRPKRKKEDDREELPDEDIYATEPEIEIPLHPMLAMFELKRQLRLRVHVDQITEYVYDAALGDKLVLPKDVRALVNMLLAHKGVFKDIIAGKGGGAIILCAGAPGTGKTLTAEVYSEVMKRPLYSVQCAQLGTEPEELETELMKVFARAQRWNAILLLDEADVYVRRRGDDLQQNAIVGVFLRVLEYYSGVLFLTTNRAEMVDDAIASRCIARITYETPPVEDQKKLWRILSAVQEQPLKDEMIEEIVAAHPELSGRDIKNLLKLAGLVTSSEGGKVTPKTIEFVKRFKPTGGVEKSSRAGWPKAR